MQFIVALLIVGTAAALPQQFDVERPIIKILRSDVSPIDGANFRYSYETENGITADKEGFEGPQGQSNMVGSFSFPLPDGTLAEFTYTADENGYVAQSPLIPTPHPMPAHALEQIRIAAEQRAQGIDWDEQGFRI